MKKLIWSSIAVAGCLFAGGDAAPVGNDPVMMNNGNTIVSLKVGTLGVGVDASKMLNDNTAVRVNVNGFKYSGNEEIEGIEYDADLTLFTAGVLVDYYPSGSGFRVSAGAYYNGNELTGTARLAPGDTITIGDNSYNSGEIGKVDATIDFDPIAPYIGIGYTSTEPESGWSFNIDAGVMYHGKANVSMTPTIIDTTLIGTTLDAQIRDDIDREIQEVKDKIEDYPLYPVVMIGATYGF